MREWHASEQPGPLILLPVNPSPSVTGSTHPLTTRLRVDSPATSWVSALLAGHELLEPMGRAFRQLNGAVVLPGAVGIGGPLQRRAELDSLVHETDQATRELATTDASLAQAANGLIAAESSLIDAQVHALTGEVFTKVNTTPLGSTWRTPTNT